jgi:hypothetical protein
VITFGRTSTASNSGERHPPLLHADRRPGFDAERVSDLGPAAALPERIANRLAQGLLNSNGRPAALAHVGERVRNGHNA